MTFFKYFISFTGIFGLISGAFSDANRARPSMINTAMSRMPSMSYQANMGTAVGNASNSVLTNNTNSNQPSDKECIDSYTTCLKKGDVCGEKFEECTNKTLFYAKKTECTSTLMQCKTSGVASLFGVANQSLFATKNAKGDYVYPTDGSILGQMIESAFINNRYDTSQCVRKYEQCLRKDNVCGQDFELCTSNEEFKKQKIFCESTLARCEPDGKKELFGSENTSSDPSSSSRLGNMIKEGADLAGVNAVATCYKVVDQCILNTCAKNPYKCKAGTDVKFLKIVSEIVYNKGNMESEKRNVSEIDKMPDNNIIESMEKNINGDKETTTKTYYRDDVIINGKHIKGYIKNNCFETINNKFCHMTVYPTEKITPARLRDEDRRDNVFEDIYKSRMNSAIAAKIDESIDIFKKKFKSKCADTIIDCAMRNCGSGNGAACYAKSKEANGVNILNQNSKSEITAGCKSIVSSDNACRFALSEWDSKKGTFNLVEDFDKNKDIAKDNFEKLFGENDIVGAVAELNSRLSRSFSDSALNDMKKKCQRTASNCVRSLCGKDFQNCYRNRTDVYGSITNTSYKVGNIAETIGINNNAFDKSMNKVGGVLDYTIVIGLCLDTVKNNKICEEHIKVEVARDKVVSNANDKLNSWGGNLNVRDAWLGGGLASTVNEFGDGKIVETDENGKELCYKQENDQTDLSKCVCGSLNCNGGKVEISEKEYFFEKRTNSVFMDLIRDLELEVQAKYNAKITKEQNMCIAHNKGGIMGSKDIASTYMWAKLKGNKVPNNYSIMGLKEKDYTPSNDLYGSFCRVKVTIQSDNKEIQKKLQEGQDWATGYFAAGDTIMCGSWIPQSVLKDISEEVGNKAKEQETKNDRKNIAWITAGSAIAGAIGGGFLTDHLQKNTGFGGLLGVGKKDDPVEDCKKYAQMYISMENGEEALPIGKKAISIASSVLGTNLNSIENSIEVAAGTTIEDKEKEIRKEKEKIEKANNRINSATTEEHKKTAEKQKTEAENRLKSLEEQLNSLKSSNERKDGNLSVAKLNANKNMESLIGMCDGFSSKDVKNKKIARNNIIGAGIGALTAGTVASLASIDAFDRQGQEAKEKAIKDWLDTVGSQIKCYVGAEEVGTYGTTFTIDLEDE